MSERGAAAAPAVPTTPEGLACPLRDCVTMAFPTPIVVHEWPNSEALNAALRELVLAEERGAPGVARSNVGGWHSDTRFLERPDAAVRALVGRVRTVAVELTRAFMAPRDHRFQVEGWANVLRGGHYNSLHNHPNATWSGVYYVTGNPAPAAAAPFGGKIEFVDPRPAASLTYSTENALQRRCLFGPNPGVMLVFPSWLQHLVHPYAGPGERISIAFNVTVT